MAKVDAGESRTNGSMPSSSIKLTSGAALSTTQLEGGGASQGGGSTDPSVDIDVSNDGSYFILDGGGRHVLDDQGSPARARKWQPVNAQQRERYSRQHLSTKGPGATSRWLPSVLVSPNHLNVPKAQRAKSSNTINGGSLGTNSFISSCAAQQHAVTSDSIGGGSNGSGSGSGNGSGGGREDKFGVERRREIERARKRRRALVEERKRTRPKELDGFMLMDACGCDLPDEGRRADVSGTGLVSAVQEDLTFFVRLQTLDAGDNTLPFDAFAVLPQLDELRLPCNSIRDVVLESGGYSGLRRLDLSYNSLSGDALSMLARLPSLTDLDLTCNGLTELPDTVENFQELQKLSLERNQLESDAVVDVLSKLPALRELSLAFNYFTGVNLAQEAVEGAFPLLEGLDLGFNYIADQQDVVVLVLLERLQRVILYGNPLAGPTGEDPLGLCVEDLIDKADRVRAGYASCPLEVITEMPRAKHSLAGGGVGRRRQRQRRPYSDTGVTMVDEGHLPSSMAFRASGNESLFRFERSGRGGSGSGRGGEPPGAIVEATLRLAKERTKRRSGGGGGGGGGEKGERLQDMTFLTGVERQDDTNSRSGDDRGQEEQDDEEMVFAGLADGGGLGQGGGGGVMSTRLLRGPAIDPAVRNDPAKLRMALTALRYALKHPVMSSMDAAPERKQGHTASARERERGGCGGGREGGVGRKTAAARARQLPRRPHTQVKEHQDLFARTLDGARGVGDLGKVDEVLTSMGVGLDEMALEKRARGGKNGHAQPGRPGLSSIVRTVNAVLDENEY